MIWRITFRRRDNIGIADFIRDVEARDSGWAHDEGLKLLKAAHEDWKLYTFQSAIRIRQDVEGVPI